MPVRVLRASADATVAADEPAANHGADAVLRVASQGYLEPEDKRLLCRFDLAGLPAAAVRVVEAKLRLTPTASAPDRMLRCHEVTGDWTEDGVTWDTQPAVGANLGTQPSEADPQEWNVTAPAQGAFPAGLVAFRVKDDAEGALLGHLQEYSSREGTGTPPELVITYEATAAATLRSSLTVPERSGASALDAAVRVRRSSARWQQVRRAALSGAAGETTTPAGVAYDAGRDALWVADQVARKVRRYARGTLALEVEYAVPEGFQPVGVAWDGASLWLSDDASGAMTVRRFRVEADALVEEASFAHPNRTVLAWDPTGATLWSADPVVGRVYRHRMDAGLGVEETFTGLPEVWGLAFPTDREGEVLSLERDGSGADGFRLRRRRREDLALLESVPYTGRADARPLGLALVPGRATAHLLHSEEQAGDLLVRPPVDLSSRVRPGRIPGAKSLASAVRPANVPGDAVLASRLRVNVPGLAVLRSAARPRVAAKTTLTCIVRPRETQVAARGQLRGIIATPVVVDAQDFLDISTEVGSSIIHTTTRGERRSLRRVVQLLDARETLSFPREVTSEPGRAGTQDVLRRGDAVLYAAGGDAFRPGDTVAWQGLGWVVVGLLAAEMVGDVALYREVGLRRLGVMAQARVQGTVAEARE